MKIKSCAVPEKILDRCESRITKEKNILLVDDCEEFRIAVISYFKKRNVPVYTMDTLEGIENLITQHRINILILDNKIGGKKGLDRIPGLRTLFPDLVIVLVTGYPNTNVAADSIKFGADDFVEKPFVFEEFENNLDSLVLKRLFRKRTRQLSTEQIKLTTLSETIATVKNKVNNLLSSISVAADYIFEKHLEGDIASEDERLCYKFIKEGIKDISNFFDSLEKLKHIEEVEYFDKIKMIKF